MNQRAEAPEGDRMDQVNAPIEHELRISPGMLALVLAVAGFVLVGAADGRPDSNQQGALRLLALGAYSLAVLVWGLSRWKLAAGRWLGVAALVVIIGLGGRSLNIPHSLSLLAIPTGVAAALISLRGAAVIAAAETILLLAASAQGDPYFERTSVTVTCVAIWAVFGLMCAAYERMYAVARSYGGYYQRAQQLVEDVRDREVELKQALADLADANLQLVRLNNLAQGLRHLAEEARRAKEEFVANVSHELRTPLNMIVGFAEMILRTPESYGESIPPALLADLAVIHRNSEHLSSLVDDVLDLSQLDMGEMALTKERVDFREVVESAATVVQPLFASKGLYLETELPPDLAPVLCDRTRMREVVVNLLSNAGRFTERGGVTVRVQQAGDALIVGVTDTGPGIAAERQAELFQPFHQLDGSIRRRYGGSGLGLSITKRFVELHEGHIWVESEEGEGTTFFFQLPLESPVRAEEQPSRWLVPSWEHRVRLRRSKAPISAPHQRFVVLEKGVALQRLLDRYLDGAQIEPVTTLDQAFQAAANAPAQGLLVNDVSVARALRRVAGAGRLPPGVPVIVCPVPGARQAADELSVSDYLVKPVRQEHLLEALD
ncbi:MAG: HAMP domain-containing histidine kinase, partial [Anaerolineales bacterium]|nr:HAMP domain-containing histidine kinase [Anaerolineales bacterium]